jgi:MFS family permease
LFQFKIPTEQSLSFIFYGFCLCFFSGFGQTYFIAIFNGSLSKDLSLSLSQLGSLYGAATFSSALLLIPIGKLIDEIDLRFFTFLSFIILSLACVGLSKANGPLTLYLSFLILRLGGQGLMSHTAMTSMSRYFQKQRGIATSISNIGFAAGIAFFPIMAAKTLQYYDWREIWATCSLLLIFLIMPFCIFLLRDHADRHEKYMINQSNQEKLNGRIVTQGWSRRFVIRDKNFYLLLPLIMTLPFIATGIQFHQVVLVAEKGWSLTMWASGYSVAAIFNVIGGLFAGFLLTYLGGVKKVVPWFILPLVISLSFLILFESTNTIWFFMLFNGLAGGIYGVVNNILWVELYGTTNIGSIRSLIMSIGIFAAALAPAAMGYLIDAGLSIRVIALGSVMYIFLSMFLASFANINSKSIPSL